VRENNSSKISHHAAKLMQRRHQRFYGPLKEGKDHCNITLSRPIMLSASPVAIAARQATEESTNVYFEIKLLGKVAMEIHASGGIICNVPLNLNPKTLQLLAYIAWKRGVMIRRDKMLEEIWGHGRTDEDEIVEGEEEKMREAFKTAKKALRGAIQKAVRQWNDERGEIMIDPNDPRLDIFCHKYQMWWLSSLCQVADLEELEKQYKIIKEAEKRGTLFNSVPDHVKEACYMIIDMLYTGDFLQTLIINYPDVFDPWYSSWVRVPVTHYRDYYLQALLYAAQHEQEAAKSVLDIDSLSNIEMQRERLGRAAGLYKTYAMSACSNRFDLKIYFGLPNRGDGERVKRGEEAMRNCIKLYGKLGNLNLIDETYNAYCDHMRDISDENWEPSEETLKVIQVARERAAAYRPEE
jgi:hypothetical protein